MSLLDDVSIVVTPNGYKAGELYAVKPTFALGSELVTNSIFNSDNTSDWGNGFYDSFTFDSSEGGFYNLQRVTADARTNINLSSVLTVGKRYKVTVVARGSGNIKTGLTTSGYTTQPSAVFTLTSSFASYSTIVTVTSGLVYGVLWNDDGNSNIDYQSYSVKEYTASDMDVTRATAATRVDENGLVNYAEVLGSEIADITSGTPVDASNWANVTSNSIDFTGLGASGVSYYNDVATGLVSGETYIISLTISNFSGSSDLGVSGQGGVPTSLRFINDGTETKVFTSDGSNIRIFGRAGTNTATFSNFSIKKVHKNNVPRIDYTGGGCPHILSEPQRTNLVTYSEDFSQSYWTKAGSTVEIGFTSPDGTENAYKLKEDLNTSAHSLYRSNFSTNTLRTFSVFAKASEKERISIYDANKFGKFIGVIFNLTSGIVESNQDNSIYLNPKIELISNGWYRCSVTWQNAALQVPAFAPAILSTNVYTGDGVSGIYVYGAQFEEATYPTSYIPTSGSTVTRNQDVFTRDGIGSLINDSEGVLFAEMAALDNDLTTRMISLSDGGNTNRIHMFYHSVSNEIAVNYRVSGTTEASIGFVVSNITNFNKIAFKWKSGDFALWINGVEVGTDSNTTMLPADTLNKLAFEQGNGGNNLYAKVKQLQIYKTALTDSELATLTTI